jgi:cob(I)alamin adenosyltransferase
MKIYTRTGDDGTTGLIGGARASKADLRVECYGTLDELNAAIGLGLAQLPLADNAEGARHHHPLMRLRERLLRVQNELFVLGSHLATMDAHWAAALPSVDEAMILRLEQEMDQADEVLPPLKQFILPGGTVAAAALQLARTICRRAERLVVALSQSQPVEPLVLAYINRLADWLFVEARLANHLENVQDVPWRK